ncbi:MAG: putative porin [Candidatus Omnitrophota bacterium]
MKKLIVGSVFLCFMLMVCGVNFAQAGEIDLLLQKLVEKGVLTGSEAQQVKTETQEQVKKEIAQGKFSSLPQWVQNTKIKGDFRLRYQYDHAKRLSSTQGTDKQRARMRVRLGVESKINDKLLVGIGLATGISSTTDKDGARSTNVDMGSGFTKKNINLDYAYAQYSPTPWATIVGGKFKNTLWEPGDLIWDTDINPEGASLKLSKNINPKTSLFMNTGMLVVETDTGSGSPATMFIVQPGFNYDLTPTIGVKGAVSYYDNFSVKGKTLSGTVGTNSKNAAGKLLYDYQNITPALQISFKEPFKAIGISVPYLALFGEYVQNINSSVKDDNTGFMLGFKYGAEKIENFGDWQFRYNYAMLGKDAVLDILPDSDRYGGKTGMRSHEGMFDFGLGKNTWLGLDYYYGWQIPGNFASTQTKPAQVLQLDWNMKF